MKTLFKQLILSITATSLAVIGIVMPSAQASAATFNTDSADYPTVQVSNYTDNPGCSSCWATSAQADRNDIVSVLVYYHNTATDIARNVKLRVSLPTGNVTSASINGTVSSDNSTTASGQASINISSSQSLTIIPGTIKWYPNRGTNTYPLLNGQSGTEIVGNGLYIGDIAPGWSTQGYVTFRAQVSNNNADNNNNNPNVSLPTIHSTNVLDINRTTATLSARVSPNGDQTTVQFEWGTDQSLNNHSRTYSVNADNTTINEYLSGLAANTTYYFRATAANSAGTRTSSIISFQTTGDSNQNNNAGAPSAITRSASSVSDQNVRLNGTVNPNGGSTSVWFEWGQDSSLGNRTSTQTISGTYDQDVSEYISGLIPNRSYYFRVVASNSYGTDYGSTMSFYTNSSNNNNNNYGYAPIARNAYATNVGQSFANLNATVNPNGDDTTVSFEYGTSPSFFDRTTSYQSTGLSNYERSISIYVYGLAPNTTYYFRGIARNNFGVDYTDTGTFTTSYSNSYNDNNQYNSQPLVTTNSATFIYQTFASLNGTVDTKNYSTDTWFEWGETVNLGNMTSITAFSPTTNVRQFSYVLTGLKSATTYYFRANARNAYGTVYGSILSFTTPGNAVVTTPAPTYTAPVVSAPSSNQLQMILTSLASHDTQRVGEDIIYKVLYRNSGRTSVRNAVLSIAIPKELEYQEGSAIPDSTESDGSIIRYDLGRINAGSESTIALRLKVKDQSENPVKLMANLKYVNGNGVSETATTEIELKTQSANSTLASLFDLNLPWVLYGFLLLILIGILGYYLISQKKKVSATGL